MSRLGVKIELLTPTINFDFKIVLAELRIIGCAKWLRVAYRSVAGSIWQNDLY
jgi:hypothetical protein